MMDKIESFKVDHINLKPGIYVSRKDYFGSVTLTTFDIRMTAPNREPAMGTAEIHTIEHLGATFLRNHSVWKERTVYFGPMGCRTGFYMILEGDLNSIDIISLIKELFKFISDYTGKIPGASAKDCGNYLDLNLDMAIFYARHYLESSLNQKTIPTEYI